MSERVKEAVVTETLRAFVAYMSGGREIAKAKEAAGKLHFWGEGMLDEIKQIANGKAKAKTYKELQKEFDENDEPAREAMLRLRQMRNKFAGNHIARAIERCINADGQGKNKILSDISVLLNKKKDSDAPAFASEVIRDIEVLNANLDHLHRLLEAER
ncbi:hypothetical protein [Bradyrhizobium sp. 192]|uniref:hypothetical protein n=1 Tax=Bradyrhizobium sp. 192 TaxID=2782660 RepID=UPI001FFFD8E7|nr:hypothetical protein [Bradyrhizobium sp. 192]UPJ59726.1 hypothetical protein IVB24_08020 [Bradyrhizobium sp. 192]